LKWRWVLPTSKADSQGTTHTDDFPFWWYRPYAVHRIDELNRRNPGGGQSNHYPKIPFGNLFYCTHTEARAKMAIPGCRGSAALQVTQYDRAGFFARALLDFTSHYMTDAS
jgi:hypothetical protein